ncbi:MAG: tetratricopeptide repeat protein [Bacteroidetes bacterium]|nr:tetratricopeptide repeat protein [Bacteroidota bacterium]
MMRIIGLLIVLLIGGVTLAQDNIIALNVTVNDEDAGKRLAGATMEIMQDGKPFKTVTSASNGKFPIVDMPLNHTYTIYIKKDGYVTKVSETNAYSSYPEDLPKVLYQEMEISIFKTMEGVDFSFLESTPMAKFEITQNGYVEHDPAYTKDMLAKITKLKEQMELQRLENEKKEAEKKKAEADFNAYMKAGNDAMTATKYDVAISQYEFALKIIPNEPTAVAKLEEAKKKKAELEKANADQKAYSDKLAAAKLAYDSKKLEEALTLYKEASTLKPAEAFPKERILAIEAEIAKQKEQVEQFNKLVAEGDAAVGSKLYDDAITKYTAALAIKADPAVQTKLDNAKKLKLEKEQGEAKAKELEAKYTALMKEADVAFNAQNYTLAKTKYTEALAVKAGDPTATAQLAKIDEILKKKQEELDAANKKEADYKKLMAEGETLFTQKNWEAAKQKYVAALEIKPNDPPALAKIDLINKELEKQTLETKKNEDYNRLMAEAKVLYDQKKYAEAKQKYQEASNVKPDQADPKNQIIAIDKLLADQEKLALQEKNYQALITEGNSLKDIKDYTAALDRYNKALLIKPGDVTATQKIAEINKILDEQKKLAEQEKLFADYVTKGDQSFNAKDYTTAKMNYQKALEIKADPTLTAKIKEIDELIAKSQNEQQIQAKYDAAIKEADAFYKAGDLTKAQAKYEEALAIKSAEVYPKEKIAEIKQKLAAQQDQAQKDQQFKDFVAAGDAAYTAKEYQKALASYQEALKVKPDPTITQKIGQLNTLIAQQTQEQQTEERYKAKIAEADAAYNAKSWDTARNLYREALTIKVNDTYANGRIADIEKQMQAETNAEVEQNYQKIITKADGLKTEERYDEAIIYYNNALKLKPSDPYPKQQIEAINKIKTDKANALQAQEKLTAEYNALIKEADVAFNTQNWTVALAKYKEALLKKPGEPYPQGRITEINDKMNVQTQVNQTDVEYNKYISQADALFAQKNYLEAIGVYKQALGVKSNDAYATNQIQEATRLEQAKSVEEEEIQYQKIVTAGQKKFDEGDYIKALEYYKRALGIRPNDTLVQKKIDEINQLLANQKDDGEFNTLVQQANTYFEKGDWKNAKVYYEKALAVKDDTYCKNQIDIINKKMKEESGKEVDEQYQKLIAKADEYYDSKTYDKAKGLYERALSIKPSDTYPKQRLDEIDRILNPGKYMASSDGLPDYGKPVNSTDVDIQGMLLEADDQRQFMANQKVEQQRVTAEDVNQENAVDQTDESFVTEKEANRIDQDIEEKDWSAEVHRTEANLEVIDMQIQLDDRQSDLVTANENDVQHTNQNVTNLNTEISVRNENDDLPREEYLADVERIKVEVNEEDKSNADVQTDGVHEQTNYVEQIQIEHVSNDPNMDVERKNVEVYVEDLNVVLDNRNNQDVWNQEDQVMGIKDNTEVLIDERIAENVNNDIPREEGIVQLTDYTLSKEDAERNRASDQYDETIGARNYEENMSIEIEINNMDNDIPRQQTEIKIETSELLIEENISDMSGSQNSVVNNADDELDNIEIGIGNEMVQNDKPRENYENDVVALNQELEDSKTNLGALNEDNSHATKGDTETLINQQLTFNTAADVKATENSDNTNEAVEGIVEENKTIDDGNTEEVNAVEDYVDELKQIDAINDNVPMKNELGAKYPEGVTEEIFTMNDENGLMSKYIVRRIVVINGTGYNYEKVQTRYGGVSYTRDGQPIAEYQWTDETEAATLTRN